MPRPPNVRLLMLPLLAAAAWWPSHASAQIRRCTAADGTAVYTDRPCEYIGAVERLPRAEIAHSGTRAYRGGCARTVQELVYELTAAFDTHDANRLAGVVHWVGMSSRGAYGLMDRFDTLTKRPLIDISPVYPAVRVVVPDAPSTSLAGLGTSALPYSLQGHGQDTPETTIAADVTSAEPGSDTYQPTVRRRTPVALRIEQTLVNGTTPSRTVFGLQKYLGCWWIRP